jgi:hypothetical protein
MMLNNSSVSASLFSQEILIMLRVTAAWLPGCDHFCSMGAHYTSSVYVVSPFMFDSFVIGRENKYHGCDVQR